MHDVILMMFLLSISFTNDPLHQCLFVMWVSYYRLLPAAQNNYDLGAKRKGGRLMEKKGLLKKIKNL